MVDPNPISLVLLAHSSYRGGRGGDTSMETINLQGLRIGGDRELKGDFWGSLLEIFQVSY